jgi:hypothetical protein
VKIVQEGSVLSVLVILCYSLIVMVFVLKTVEMEISVTQIVKRANHVQLVA